MTWWTDYQARRGINRKSLYVNNMKNTISTEFKNSTSYNLVKINNVDRDVRIVEESAIIKNPNKKRLLCYPDETISVGDIVLWDSENWICTEADTTSQVSDVGIISKSNNTLTIHKNNTSYQIPCIINSNVNLDTDETTYIETPSTIIVLKIPNTEITRQIKRGEIYKLGLQNYEIKDINDIVENGILKMEIEYSQEMQEEHLYTLEILNGDNLQIAQSQSLTINVELKDNGEIVTSPSLIYSSSNEEIATIDENGVVSIIGLGNVVISVSMSADNMISDSINVEIVEDVVDNYSYIIEGNSDIIKGYSQTYIAKKYNNGILVEGVEFTFSVITGTTPINSYTLNIIDNDQCSIAANSSVYYITLRATDNSNNEYIEKSIKLKNLF